MNRLHLRTRNLRILIIFGTLYLEDDTVHVKEHVEFLKEKAKQKKKINKMVFRHHRQVRELILTSIESAMDLIEVGQLYFLFRTKETPQRKVTSKNLGMLHMTNNMLIHPNPKDADSKV